MFARTDIVRRGGDFILGSGLVLGLLVILAGIVIGSLQLLLVIIAALLLTPAAAWVFSADQRTLVFLVVSFAAAAAYGEGFDIEEVLYALALWGFLIYWFVRKTVADVNSIVQSNVDIFLLLYLLYAVFSMSISLLNGAEVATMISEFYALAAMFLYFPLREAFAGSAKQGKQLLYALLVLASLIALRNFVWYALRLNSAEHLWQLATGRIVMNEHVLLPAAVVGLLLYLSQTSFRARFVVFAATALPVAGIVIGQSRALWLSFFLALGLVLLLSTRAQKVAALRVAAMGAVILLAAAYYFMGNELFTLVFAGLIDRFFSLETAATQDVSLVNRFNEIKAAFAAAMRLPVTGHGFGVPYKYYSMVYLSTYETTFIHHGYVHLFYRHGLIGVILFGGFFIGTIVTSLRALVKRTLPANERLFAILTVAVFTSIALSANSESPFGAMDKTIMMAFVAACGAGVLQRNRGLQRLDVAD